MRRTRVGSAPKYWASPPQMPAIFESYIERVSRGGLWKAELAGAPPVGVPHWEQYASDPSSAKPHFVQYIFISVMKYAIRNHKVHQNSALRRGGSLWRFTVDHPFDSEFVDHHPESVSPVGFFDRHHYCPAFRQVPKQLFGPLRVVQSNGQADVVTVCRAFGSRVVGHHNCRVPDLYCAVHDVFRRTNFGHGRFTYSLSEQYFGIQRSLIELDRFPAIPFEGDVRTDFQHHLPPLS